MSFFGELKRRNVFRVGITYILASWVLLQILDFATEVTDAPSWILQLAFLGALLGLPLALIFSWVYEMTPEGIKRESQIERSQSITPQTGRKLDRVIIGFLALAVVLLLADRFHTERVDSLANDPSAGRSSAAQPEEAVGTSEPSTEQSIAVLPFVNMSSDEEQEYFSDGISEELLNVLVRVEGLRVPSRTSSFTFKGSDKKVTDIGRELEVEHVLEGSVRRSGDRVRVTAQLIDVTTDTHLWSETYTRELDDIFAVQDEIAQAIVRALQIELSGDQSQSLTAHSTQDSEAYQQFLLGRHLWNKRTIESLQASLGPLQKAVELDPEYDRAWAALAQTYALLPEYAHVDLELEANDLYIPLGMEAANKALSINPDSAPALTARAYMKTMFQFDHSGARADYERALEFEPNYATALQWFGEFLAVQREIDAAMDYVDRAIEADPLSVIIAHVKAWLLIGAGRYEEAVAQYQRAIPLDPSMPNLYGNLYFAYVHTGQLDEAREVNRQWGNLMGTDATPTLLVIDALENPAMQPKALEAIMNWSFLSDGPMDRAPYLMLLDEPELALESLLKGYRERDAYSTHINRLVIFDPIRDDPRFQQMLREMNFAP